MTHIFAKTALLASGWADSVRISVRSGQVLAVDVGARFQPGDEAVDILVPGVGNLHSHAFQRGMAGLAEVRGPGTDSFWSWRDEMYRFALSMTPEQLEAIATMLYVEMLEEGFTRVGEFHYLHHAMDGSLYADIGEHAGRIAAAASEAGIRLTLLPVFYAHAGFGGQPPGSGQRRFISTLDQFGRLMRRSAEIIAALDGAVLGVAPHSLRAVTLAELPEVVAMAGQGPVHIHVAEQLKEVDDCLAWCGKRPVELLHDTVPVDGRWCLIHATHMTDDEVAHMAQSGAVAGLCPVTEANLGDGTFRATDFLARGGGFGIGSDSNVLVGLGDELRQLEYSQRLRDNTRNAIATAGASTGRTLFDHAVRGGARALGGGSGVIEAGAAADFVALDADNAALVARTGDALLDGWIFAGRGCVQHVWVGGRKIVSDGVHHQRAAAERRFRQAMHVLCGTNRTPGG